MRAKGLTIPMTQDGISLWFNRGNLPGRHWMHLEISEGVKVVWFGLITRLAFGPAAGGLEIRIEATGDYMKGNVFLEDHSRD